MGWYFVKQDQIGKCSLRNEMIGWFGIIEKRYFGVWLETSKCSLKWKKISLSLFGKIFESLFGWRGKDRSVLGLKGKNGLVGG